MPRSKKGGRGYYSNKKTKRPKTLAEKVAQAGGKDGFVLEVKKSSTTTPKVDIYGRPQKRQKRNNNKSCSTTSKKKKKESNNNNESLTGGASPRAGLLYSSSHEQQHQQQRTRDFTTPAHRRPYPQTPKETEPTNTSTNTNTSTIASTRTNGTMETPAFLKATPAPFAAAACSSSTSSSSRQNRTIPHQTNTKTPSNPYGSTKRRNRTAPPTSSRKIDSSQLQSPSWSSQHQHQQPTHVICAISENLARETCIASLDAGSPVTLSATKQGNGQTYAETLAFLKESQPHEVLLNEGRRNSQLAIKVLELFGSKDEEEGLGLSAGGAEKKKDNIFGNPYQTPAVNRQEALNGTASSNAAGTTSTSDAKDKASLTGACPTQTIVKFLPRSYFDQTKGAELLSQITREGVYDPSVVGEYILLSSAHAALQYLQLCLGANFERKSLDVNLNWGGMNRMAIDRSSLVHLELLANAKTGRMQNSLVGSIDCTKTTVGSRLLRSNLIAPPTRLETIHARLDLVDAFLDDEDFFYEVMEQLGALPDVDKMLSHMALVPRRRDNNLRGGGQNGGKSSFFGNGEKRKVTARMASRGISALVCIKSTLKVIPNFARVLDMQLQELDQRGKSSKQRKVSIQTENTESSNVPEQESGAIENDDSDSISQSNSSVTEETSIEDEQANETGSTRVSSKDSNLLLGLGGASSSATKESEQRHELLRVISRTMKQPQLKEILDAVLDIFTESTTYSRNSHAMRHQECFALKPNTDGMMDVLRKAFLANVDDIYRLADEYAEKFGFTVTVKETTARGFYLSIPAVVSSELPQVFIQPVKTGRFINCTTEEVHSLNSRAQENVQDLLIMTHDRIQEVIHVARQKYDSLASLSDAIALIDMCHCFADNVASSRLPWCRPVVTGTINNGDSLNSFQNNPTMEGNVDKSLDRNGTIAIRNGRYAIDVSKSGLKVSDDAPSDGDYIPNDTYASSSQNFTIITGINGAGKSTYLKQIAITIILAHCGSYVPAEEAFIPVRDRLCTRIGTSDDQEHNISTFMQEMKETAFICSNATDKSIILIDELGRATSNEDGVAIAWAMGEFLLVKGAMTFFVTHYPQLCKMAEVYPNVQNQHLGAIADTNSGEIRFMHKIKPGPCKMSTDYGIEMALTCGWQEDVVKMARHIRKDVEKKLPEGILCYNDDTNSQKDMFAARHQAESILKDLCKQLVALKVSEGRLNKQAFCAYLQDLRSQFSLKTQIPVVAQMIKNLLLDKDEVAAPSIPLQSESLSSGFMHTSENLSSTQSLQDSVCGDDPNAHPLLDKDEVLSAPSTPLESESLSSGLRMPTTSENILSTESLQESMCGENLLLDKDKIAVPRTPLQSESLSSGGCVRTLRKSMYDEDPIEGKSALYDALQSHTTSKTDHPTRDTSSHCIVREETSDNGGEHIQSNKVFKVTEHEDISNHGEYQIESGQDLEVTSVYSHSTESSSSSSSSSSQSSSSQSSSSSTSLSSSCSSSSCSLSTSSSHRGEYEDDSISSSNICGNGSDVSNKRLDIID